MSKVIHKWFWPWNFENQEVWLNKMSFNGMHLRKVEFCTYTFEEGKVNEYQYKIEMLENSVTTDKAKEYIAFLEDTGIEYIGNITKWIYLRKKRSEGEFKLFCNIDSHIVYLNRIMKFFIAFLCMEMLIGIDNVIKCINDIITQNVDIINTMFSLLFILIYILLVISIYKIGFKIKDLKSKRVLQE
jgi:hypothetical protein